MKSKRSVLLGVGLVALAVGFDLLLVAGCSVAQYESSTVATLSPRHTTGPVIAGRLVPEQLTTWSVDPPFELEAKAQVLLGDVHARSGQELVVIAPRGLAVYSLRGRLLTQTAASESTLTAGVLADVNGDRKLDIVVGSIAGADPVVRSYDGRGRLIRSRRLQVSNESVGEVRPVGTLEGDLLVTAGDLWIAGPRGVFRLRPPRLETAWFAAVPTGLLGGTVLDERIFVSTITQTNGEFDLLGASGEQRFGFDARPHVLAFDQSGKPVSEIAIGSTDHANAQESWVLPLSDRHVAAHRRGATDELIIFDTVAGVVDERRPVDGAVTHLMVARGGDQPLLVLVTTRAGTGAWRMELLDAGLAVLHHWSGAEPAPVPVGVVELGGATFDVIAYGPRGLTRFGANGAAEMLGDHPPDDASDVSVALGVRGSEGVLFALAARRLTVIAMPLERVRD